MNDTIGVISKVLLASAGIAIAIKYGAPALPLPATALVAWVMVLLPTLIMGAWLGWRSLTQE